MVNLYYPALVTFYLKLKFKKALKGFFFTVKKWEIFWFVGLSHQNLYDIHNLLFYFIVVQTYSFISNKKIKNFNVFVLKMISSPCIYGWKVMQCLIFFFLRTHSEKSEQTLKENTDLKFWGKHLFKKKTFYLSSTHQPGENREML